MSITDVLSRLDDIENSFNNKFNVIEKKLDTMTARVDTLESMIEAVEKKTKSLSLLEKKYQDAIKKTKTVGVMAEFKSKELNVIFNNIPQDDLQEDMKASLEKAKTVMKEVLKIDDEVNITHAHRLPKGGSDSCRPLIVKVASMFDKDKLWKKVGNVRAYNEGKEDGNKRYVEMMHLPNKLFIDKMSLKDDFKKHKKAGRKPKWRLDKQNAEFCFVIGAIRYRPEARNDK